uniref:glutathione transferase n=1 Tax=Oncorhynchus tshawytscha TaxID=74940 RepID=A0AAZ3P9J1_ONCTS
MTSYKLTYFNMRGRAELPRYIFAYAGIAFEDRRVEWRDWPSIKKNYENVPTVFKSSNPGNLGKVTKNVNPKPDLTMENILAICVVLLENMEGMMKLSSDISSSRLFCTGVPVRSNRCSAWGHRDR